MSETNTTNAPSAPQSHLRPSLLAAKADAMWTASKQQFQNSGKTISMGAIKLKTKTFSEITSTTEKPKEEKAAEEASKPKFIFGQNIASRVLQTGTIFNFGKDKSNDGTNGETKIESGLVGKSYDEFKKEAEEAAAKQKDEHEKNLPTTSIIEVKTGEEDDQTIFQSGCKLHVYDKANKKWMEKGLVVMKISKRFDEDGEHHRIVARTTGIHKLVINSQIFADMLLERVDLKRFKLSAMNAEDPPAIQCFLFTFSFTNSDLSVETAFNTLQSLISKVKSEKSRKRKVSENEQVSEVEAKMEKTEIESSKSDNKFSTGGFDDCEHSSSSTDTNEAQDSAQEADNEQQTTPDSSN